MMLIVTIVALLVYMVCPQYLKLVFFVVNIFVPDVIPVIDEVIMAAGLLLPKG